MSSTVTIKNTTVLIQLLDKVEMKEVDVVAALAEQGNLGLSSRLAHLQRIKDLKRLISIAISHGSELNLSPADFDLVDL